MCVYVVCVCVLRVYAVLGRLWFVHYRWAGVAAVTCVACEFVAMMCRGL